MIAFLDIPHTLYMYLKRGFRKYNDEMEDDWYFDLGYQYAFSISVFIMTLIFVVSAPLLSIAGWLFFLIKYLVDKHNLTKVYKKEFESQGELASSVKRYIAFGIFLFQLSMCGIFTTIIKSEDLAIGSIIVVLGEVLYMIVFEVLTIEELKDTFEEIL
jgi:quinol-cytochrome oxidoreductase complex cytochrome b subunit